MPEPQLGRNGTFVPEGQEIVSRQQTGTFGPHLDHETRRPDATRKLLSLFAKTCWFHVLPADVSSV